MTDAPLQPAPESDELARFRQHGRAVGRPKARADGTDTSARTAPQETSVEARTDVRELASAFSLGWIAVTSGLGLLVVSVADFRARLGLDLSEALFWIGLAILVLPIALALWSPLPTRTQRMGAVILLGLGLYGVRIFYSPGTFVFSDEFSHWRTAIDIGSTGTLFSANPLSLTSAVYPGLESFTAVFASLAGLGVSQAAVIVIGVARIVVLVALYLFFERASGSTRVAGLAALIYTANQSFVFFDAQFAYESFALALAATAIAALALRSQGNRSTSGRLTVVALLAIAATVVTHHVTSYGLVVFLGLWVLLWHLNRRRACTEAPPPIAAAAFAAAAAGAWLLLVAPQTIAYLTTILQGGLQQAMQLISGQIGVRSLLTDRAGLEAPLAERAVAYLAVFLTLAALLAGLWTIVRHARARPLALTLGLVALIYPASLVLRLTTAGAETAARMSAFAFLGVAFVSASWGASVRIPRISAAPRVLLAGGSAIVFAGGVIAGSPSWGRLPYPYRAAADPRSIEAEGIDAAQWTLDHLGPDQVFVTDRTNRLLLGTYGHQDATLSWQIAQILLSTQSAESRQLIAQAHIDYVLVDRRLATAVPLAPGYVEAGEMGGVPFTAPLDPTALAKFDTMSGSSRVFDSGDIQIFDVRDIR